MSSYEIPDYSAVVSATGFLRPRASRSVETFHDHLTTSNRILALLGAGVSAPSGIPTYRGAGGVWRTLDVTTLATPTGFEANPALVWTFELERRKLIEEAKPNAAHVAISNLAKKKQDFLALTMNVDDLSERAGHPGHQLHHLHGSTFDVKCAKCAFRTSGIAADDAIRPLLQRDPYVPLQKEDIPRCAEPNCSGFLRPGIIWFTENIPRPLLTSIYEWFSGSEKIDTMLVIGTSALVYPAASYIQAARRKGARVAVVDIEKEDPSLLGLEEQDWYFQGNAAMLVPEMLKPAVGA